jgi:nucleotide-binding universal stress UspA family protein
MPGLSPVARENPQGSPGIHAVVWAGCPVCFASAWLLECLRRSGVMPMFPPKRILFPVDFSDRCAAAAPMVEAFARRFQSELHVLHVTPPDAPDDPDDCADAKLVAFAARKEFQGLCVYRQMLQGDPAREIVEFAHDRKFDLIMMPTHGYGIFRRFLLGSVTQKVLHDALCPVWTDAHTEGLPSGREAKFRNVVCALDLSEKSRPTLRWAAQFAATDARLLLVHGIPSVNSMEAPYVYTDWQQELADNAREQIDCMQRREGTHVAVDIVTGEVANAVRNSAEDAKADLLVIGRSLDDGLLGRLRTHAYPIIRNAPCPVVSV